jgi:hypothetical protein
MLNIHLARTNFLQRVCELPPPPPNTHTHRTNNPSSFLLILRLPFSSHCRTSAFLVNFADFSFPYCDSSPIFTSPCPPTVLHQSHHPPSDNPSPNTGPNERIPLLVTNWMGINFLLKCAPSYQTFASFTWYTGYNRVTDLTFNAGLRICLIIFDISHLLKLFKINCICKNEVLENNVHLIIHFKLVRI